MKISLCFCLEDLRDARAGHEPGLFRQGDLVFVYTQRGTNWYAKLTSFIDKKLGL